MSAQPSPRPAAIRSRSAQPSPRKLAVRHRAGTVQVLLSEVPKSSCSKRGQTRKTQMSPKGAQMQVRKRVRMAYGLFKVSSYKMGASVNSRFCRNIPPSILREKCASFISLNLPTYLSLSLFQSRSRSLSLPHCPSQISSKPRPSNNFPPFVSPFVCIFLGCPVGGPPPPPECVFLGGCWDQKGCSLKWYAVQDRPKKGPDVDHGGGGRHIYLSIYRFWTAALGPTSESSKKPFRGPNVIKTCFFLKNGAPWVTAQGPPHAGFRADRAAPKMSWVGGLCTGSHVGTEPTLKLFVFVIFLICSCCLN